MSEKLPEGNDSIPNNGIKIITKVTTEEISKYSNDILNITKLDHAKNVLSQEQYNIIGDKWLSVECMTIKKINILAKSELSIEQISVLGGEAIAYKNMTDQKLTVIGYMLSPEDIIKIGVKNLVEMSIDELNLVV